MTEKLLVLKQTWTIPLNGWHIKKMWRSNILYFQLQLQHIHFLKFKLNIQKVWKKSFCEWLISCFGCLHLTNTKHGRDPILPEVTIESWSTTLKSFELSRKLRVHNLFHSFEVSNYHILVIWSANNRNNC